MPDFNQLNLAQVFGQADQDRGTQLRNQMVQDQLGRDAAFRSAIGGMQQPGQTDAYGQPAAGPNVNQLFAIDPERAMQYTQYQSQQNQLVRQQRIDEAKQTYDKVSYVAQSKNPKALAETVYPEFVQHWDDIHGPGSWEKLSDDQAKQLAQGLVAHYGSLAGIGPEKPNALNANQTLFSQQQGAIYTAPPEPISPYQAAEAKNAAGRLAEDQRHNKATEVTAAAGNANTNAQNYQNTANKLRGDYAQVTQQTGFNAVSGAYERMKTAVADPSAAGDLSLIFSYMKILDPGSTVREGEFATAQNSGSAFNRAGSLYNKVISGERLTEPQRADFLKQSSRIYDTAYKRQQSIDDDYSEKAKRGGVDPKDVIVNYGQSAPGGPVKIASDADYAKVPTGTQYIAPDGSTRTKR